MFGASGRSPASPATTTGRGRWAALLVISIAMSLVAACDPPPPSWNNPTGDPTVPQHWDYAPAKCDPVVSPSIHASNVLDDAVYGCQMWFNVECYELGATPGTVNGAAASDQQVTSVAVYGGSAGESTPVPVGVRIRSRIAPVQSGADAGTNPWSAAAGLIGASGALGGTEIRAVNYTIRNECVYGNGRYNTASYLKYLWSSRHATSYQCQNFEILVIGGFFFPKFGVGAPYACKANGDPGGSTSTPFLTVAGASYQGPGYVCAPDGINGTFFNTPRYLAFGYPGTSQATNSWRMVGPSFTGDPNGLTLWEDGIPLAVPVGSICDARHDPFDPGRTTDANYSSLKPVPANFTGTGQVCNPSGTWGTRGSERQPYLPTYRGAVTPWNNDYVAMYFGAQAWLVPRMDVCA